MKSETSFDETLELLQRAKGGDQASLGRVLDRYREPLLSRVRLMMGSGGPWTGESGDFVHDVFARVLERFDEFELRDERSFLRWATVIARNHVRSDWRRRRDVTLETLAIEGGLGATEDDSPLGAAERVERIARVVDVLAELEEDQRRVVELRHFDQLPFAEIGRKLGRSENAVQLLHARVLLQLGNQLQGEPGH